MALIEEYARCKHCGHEIVRRINSMWKHRWSGFTNCGPQINAEPDENGITGSAHTTIKMSNNNRFIKMRRTND